MPNCDRCQELEKQKADLQAKLEELKLDKEYVNCSLTVDAQKAIIVDLKAELQRLRTENATLQEIGITMSSQIGRFQIENAEKDRIIAALKRPVPTPCGVTTITYKTHCNHVRYVRRDGFDGLICDDCGEPKPDCSQEAQKGATE